MISVIIAIIAGVLATSSIIIAKNRKLKKTTDMLTLFGGCIGFKLGYSLISKYLLEKNESNKESGLALLLKHLQYQIPTGFIIIILGFLSFIL